MSLDYRQQWDEMVLPYTRNIQNCWTFTHLIATTLVNDINAENAVVVSILSQQVYNFTCMELKS